jgi:hypothetical protein
MVENDFGLEAAGMGFKTRHQLGALDAIGIGRPVVHFGGGHQLAALGHAGDQHRLEIGAGGIDGGGVTGGAGTEDDEGLWRTAWDMTILLMVTEQKIISLSELPFPLFLGTP